MISRYLPYRARPHPALYKINGQAITEAFPSRNRCAGGLQRADRRASSGVASDTASLSSKVNVYHLTEKELSTQATINGYKYWPDAALDP